MKRNSSSAFRICSSSNPTISKPVKQTEATFTCSRRAMLITSGLFFITPFSSIAQSFKCGDNFRIAILAPMTGDLAKVGQEYSIGAKEAVKQANRRGCLVELIIEDTTNTSPVNLMRAAMISEERHKASVIIASFGPASKSVAERVTAALIFDISQKLSGASGLSNLVSLPYSAFFTTNPNAKDNSLRSVGREAVNIVIKTIESSAGRKINSPKDLVSEMARHEFQTPNGRFVLDRTTATFELVR